MTTRRAPVVLAVAAAVASVVASLLPWLRSGSAVRSGFALGRDAWAAGLADVRLGKALLVAWFLTPALTAGAWTAASLRRTRAAGFLALACGAVTVTAATAVLASGVAPLAGPYVATITGAAASFGGIWLLAGKGKEERR